MNLTRAIFWDTNYDQIDWEAKARYVIERVVNYGTLSDWHAIREHYGMDRIKEAVIQSRDLHPKSLCLMSLIFDIPKEQFRCYTQIQSNREHWTY